MGAFLRHKPLHIICFLKGAKPSCVDYMFGAVAIPALPPTARRVTWLSECQRLCCGTSPAAGERHSLPRQRPRVLLCLWTCLCRGSQVRGGWKRPAILANVCVTHVLTYFKTVATGWSSLVHLWSPCMLGLFLFSWFSSLLPKQRNPAVLSKFFSSLLNYSGFLLSSCVFWVLTSSPVISHRWADPPSHRSAGWSKTNGYRAVFL